MQLIDASKFISDTSLYVRSHHKQLRLNDSGKGNPAYLLDAKLEFANHNLTLDGTVVLGSNGRVLSKQKAQLRVYVGVFLHKNMYAFEVTSGGYTTRPMFFDVNSDGTWGVTEEGIFRPNKMINTRDVMEKRNDFDPENFGYMGGFSDVPQSIEVLFRGIGYMADVPTGSTVRSFIDRFVMEARK